MGAEYDLFIERAAHEQRKKLPGHIRQRIKKALDQLGINPYPHTSRDLDMVGHDVPDDIELRRIRIKTWRLIYAVNEDEKWVWIWGIQKRPPYDYDDLQDFIDLLK